MIAVSKIEHGKFNDFNMIFRDEVKEPDILLDEK